VSCIHLDALGECTIAKSADDRRWLDVWSLIYSGDAERPLCPLYEHGVLVGHPSRCAVYEAKPLGKLRIVHGGSS